MVEVTRSVVGGFTTGGSGAFSGKTTVAGVLEQLIHVDESLFDATGGSTFRFPMTKWPVTGGIFEASVPTSSGTLVGSSARATASVRTACVTFRSTGAVDSAGRRGRAGSTIGFGATG